MPIYEYRCEACGHELEKLQKISEDPLKDCPACGQPQLKKLVSKSGFRLKGSGWYETDFKDKKGAKKSSESNTGKSDSDSGGSKSSDSSKSDSKSSSSGSGSKKNSADAA